MKRLVLLAKARRDLINISDYIAETSDSVEVARRFARSLQGRCRSLAALPGTLGRQRDELGPGLRSVAEGNYVIVFRYVNDRLEVVRIIEGHRDLPAQPMPR